MAKPRTDQKIVDETNDLARHHFKLLGYTCSQEYKFYKPKISNRARICWEMACEAQRVLTKTDPEDALSALEPDELEMTPDEEKRCEAVLTVAFQGMHHVLNLKKTPLYWSCNVFGGVATHDFNLLTILVFAAHDHAVRVELSPDKKQMLRIMLHPRRCREGTMAARHPTLEHVLDEYRKSFQPAEIPQREPSKECGTAKTP